MTKNMLLVIKIEAILIIKFVHLQKTQYLRYNMRSKSQVISSLQTDEKIVCTQRYNFLASAAIYT